MAKPATIRELNRLRIVDTLRREGHASRSDLLRFTGLSRPTVAGLVADLHRQGLVVENESAEEPAAPGARGRPPVALRLAVSAGTAVGVDFGHGHVRVAVADSPRTSSRNAGSSSTSTTRPASRSTRPPTSCRRPWGRRGSTARGCSGPASACRRPSTA